MSGHGGVYKYVIHSQRLDYEDLGWVFSADLGHPHGNYAALYRWEGEGTPKFPFMDIEEVAHQWPDPMGGDGE